MYMLLYTCYNSYLNVLYKAQTQKAIGDKTQPSSRPLWMEWWLGWGYPPPSPVINFLYMHC